MDLNKKKLVDALAYSTHEEINNIYAEYLLDCSINETTEKERANSLFDKFRQLVDSVFANVKMLDNTVEVLGTEDDKSQAVDGGDSKPYEYVNHPTHYNNYDVEVIDMMERIWGKEDLAKFCKMSAFRYRMRMGTKPDNPIEQDLNKERWYLNKAKELSKK